jgi:broad specificity phosphatase PhoE
LKDIEANNLMQDLGKLQKENPKNKTQKLFDQAELGSDSEDQMDETENEWAKRLRQLVLRIRDVYPGSRILIFTHPGSRILDPGSKNRYKREG